MKFGLFLATQWTAEGDLAQGIDDLLEQVRVARENGFSSVWAGQHFITAPMQMVQTGPLLARLTAEAEGMTVGPSILLLSMLNPVQIAEEAATLDWLSGGNSVLAVGMGYRQEEFQVMGVPFSERVGRFTEAIKVIRRLWSEERVEHAGKHFRLDGVGASIRPKQQPGPPIWIAGEVEASVRRAARIGDAWLPIPIVTIDRLGELFQAYRQARTDAGLPLPTEQPLFRECYVGANDASALDECRAGLLEKYRYYATWGQEESAAKAEQFESKFDSFVKDRFIVGDAARVADELERYRETLGVDHFVMRMQWLGPEQSLVLKSIERLGRIARN